MLRTARENQTSVERKLKGGSKGGELKGKGLRTVTTTTGCDGRGIGLDCQDIGLGDLREKRASHCNNNHRRVTHDGSIARISIPRVERGKRAALQRRQSQEATDNAL